MFADMEDSIVEQATFEATVAQMTQVHEDEPCPVCHEEVESVAPAHALTIDSGDINERLCIAWGEPLGVSGLLVYDHGHAPDFIETEDGPEDDEKEMVGIEIDGV